MNGINSSIENVAENANTISMEQEDGKHTTNGHKMQSNQCGEQIYAVTNGHKESTTTTATTTTTEATRSKTGCTMCDDDEPNTLDLSENLEMRQTLKHYWHIPSHSISQTLSSLCVQCIYKINAHKEMTRTLQMRLHRLTKADRNPDGDGGATEENLPPPSPPPLANLGSGASNGHAHSPPNTTTPSPRKELCTSTTTTTAAAIANSQSPPHHTTTPPPVQQSGKKSPDSTIAESTEAEISQSRCAKRRVSCHSTTSTSTTSQTQHSQCMLEVYCVQPESALITESGGQINDYQRLERMQQLVCKHCGRIYLRKYHYGRHVKRCGARQRWRAASQVSAADAMGHTPNAQDVAAAAEALPLRDARTLTSTPSRVYHCPTCPVTVRSLAKLREHRRIHLKRYFCGTCGNESTALHDYEFHRVICEAKRMAQVSLELDGGATVLDQPSSPSGSTIWLSPNNALVTGRMTRSRSLALSRVSSARSRWAHQRYSSPASGSTSNSDSDLNDDGDGSADECSVADTMYSKRMCFTGDWINDPDNTCASLYNESLLDYDDETQIRTHKEYDLYLLNRLKAEILAGSLSCYDSKCDFSCETLLFMMIHDYMEHFKRSWFYCRKCTKVFTSKVFLDYHLDRQNSGRFICFKCGEIFEYQHMLDRHLIRHQRAVNYRCNYCNFEFLTEHELLQHCDAEQHDPNGERELIRIVPHMSIANVPAARVEAAPRRTFRSCVKIMNLPAVPSLRPMCLPNHQPYRRQIGDIEFKNQKIPNCWGWK